MLGVIAAVALVIGGVQTALIVSNNDSVTAEQSRAPVVEVQAVESAEVSKTGHSK